MAVTGGSGSGKSTVAAALAEAAGPGRAAVLAEDRYYHDPGGDAGCDPGRIDFDQVSARDHDLLMRDLGRLRAGLAVSAPRYSFRSHRRLKGADRVGPAPLVLVEGVHLLATPALAALFDLTVFVDTPDDVRLIRRMLRDTAAVSTGGRGRRWRQVLEQYVTTVRSGHLEHVAPQKARADLILADDSTRLDGPEPDALRTLIAPVLAHPVVRRALDVNAF